MIFTPKSNGPSSTRAACPGWALSLTNIMNKKEMPTTSTHYGLCESEDQYIPTTQEIEQIKEIFTRTDGEKNYLNFKAEKGPRGSWECYAEIGLLTFHTFKVHRNIIVTYMHRNDSDCLPGVRNWSPENNPTEAITIKENIKATKDNISGQFSQALIVWLTRCRKWDRINQLGIFQEVAA